MACFFLAAGWVSPLHAQIITTYAGNGTIGGAGDGGPATSAQLNRPDAVATDRFGNLYIADESNHRIRKITPAGVITTVAGNGNFGFSGDGGLATSAQLYYPIGVTVDRNDNIYIADTSNQRIRKVAPNGIITTIAGTGFAGYDGDGGTATMTRLNNPSAVVVDPAGNVFFTDRNSTRIRKVTTTGIVLNVAGNGVYGFSGDGGPATSAQISNAWGITLDRAGNLYIADYNNQRIRRVNTAGVIETVAGNGSSSNYAEGIPALNARVYFPTDIAVDGGGNLFIVQNNSVRRVSPDGLINTVVGGTASGYSGDGGLPNNALLRFPQGIALSGSTMYVTDNGNYVVRKVTNIAVPPAGIAVRNDLSGDGKSDIVYRDAGGTIGVVTMNGIATTASATLVPAGSGWSVTHIADFDGDGKADLLIRNTNGSVGVVLMNGTNAVNFVPIVDAGDIYTPAVVGDFNGDGVADIVFKGSDGSLVIGLMSGGDVVAASYLVTPGGAWNATHSGDFNGDGKADLIIRQSDGSTAILLMNGMAVTGASILLGAGGPWSVSHVADLDGDNKSDVVIKNTDGSAAILMMNGTTVTAASFLLTAGSPYTVTHTGDFNGDGKADLLIKHTDGSVVLLLMNGTAVSSAAFLLTAGSTATVAQIADYNGDGKSDILLKNADGSATAVLMNGTTVTAAGNVWGPGTVVAAP